MRNAWLFALSFCAASPSAAGPPPLSLPDGQSGIDADASVQADALQLARLSQPEDMVLKIGVEGFRKGVAAGMTQDPNIGELEKGHPGLTQAIVDEMTAIVEAHMKAQMPDLHRRYAIFYQQRLTPAEIKEITAFLRTPAGTRLVAAKFGNIDLDSMVEEIVLDPQAEVSADQMRRVNRIAAARTAQQTSKDDQDVMLKMLSAGTIERMGRVGTELSRFEADFANEQDPEFDLKVEDAMKRVLKRFKIEI